MAKKYQYEVDEYNTWEPGHYLEEDMLNARGKDGWELSAVVTQNEQPITIRTSYAYY